MKLKDIKKAIKHDELAKQGWRLFRIQRGFFRINGRETLTAVLGYKREKFVTIESVSVQICDSVRYYNRFGRVY